jgi:hypothetical protein
MATLQRMTCEDLPGGNLEGEGVLPGFKVHLSQLFD